MAPSAKSFRIAHGVADSAFKVQHQGSAPDGSLLTKISTTGGDEAPPATPSADAFDAEWDSVIDAATD